MQQVFGFQSALPLWRNSSKQCDKWKIEEIFFSCLGDFQQKYIQEQAERYENDTIRPVRKAKEYIQNHFSDPLTLEEVSEMVDLALLISVPYSRRQKEKVLPNI